MTKVNSNWYGPSGAENRLASNLTGKHCGYSAPVEGLPSVALWLSAVAAVLKRSRCGG